MRSHLKAIIVKFVGTSIVHGVVLSLWNIPLPSIFIVSLVLTVLGYVIGDIWMFPSYGNWITTMGDFGLSVIVAWPIGKIVFPNINILLTAVISALFISCTEWLFHKYMARNVLSKRSSHVRKEA
ncbi:DUF2512 family protein [Halobacillus massiliensis]|uniref:DUF2512 family protein n=1 Tax=Halobacillus massiliensis TaxID=1926286 RepID=UPI0015C40FA4|nr:DUF2512 family protein [Halobacillus massiliensis]